MAAMLVAGIVSQLYLNKPVIILVWSVKSLCKGLFWGHGQSVFQVISLNTLVDEILVPKARSSGE